MQPFDTANSAQTTCTGIGTNLRTNCFDKERIGLRAIKQSNNYTTKTCIPKIQGKCILTVNEHPLHLHIHTWPQACKSV